MYIMHIIDICLSIAYFLGWLPNGDDATQHDELRHATGAPGGSCSKAVVIALVFCWIWDQDFQAYPAWWTHTYTYMKCVYIKLHRYLLQQLHPGPWSQARTSLPGHRPNHQTSKATTVEEVWGWWWNFLGPSKWLRDFINIRVLSRTSFKNWKKSAHSMKHDSEKDWTI